MRKTIFTLLFVLAGLWALATHNRAGEITYTYIDAYTVKITVTTYTKASSDAKRPQIGILWGDGKTDTIPLKTNYPQNVGSDIDKNVYEGIHKFPAPGSYTISFEDPNRNADVKNIPLSVERPFYIESKVVINPFLGPNNSVQLLNPPIDNACKDVLYLHNPSPFDPDGDSLSFKIINAKGLDGKDLPGYFIPSGVSIDAKNGTLLWDKPTNLGEYNFAILCEEWRNGFLIGTVIRDLQVEVKNCNNKPPVIDPLKDTCIIAGTSLSLDVKAKDPDSLDQITLTATGGPFEVSGTKATFINKVGIDSVSSTFLWATECGHVRLSPYQVNFQAKDNDGNVPLLDLEIINIKVIGPKVQNVSATGTIDGIDLKWDSYSCSNATAFKIYRKVENSNWNPSTCETGVPNSAGYSLIHTTDNAQTTSYSDNTAAAGVKYCYRIVACFPDGSESIASDEVCEEKLKVNPIPINVSVRNTDKVNGSIFVRWINPPDLSLLNITGKLTYEVHRYENNSSSKTLVYSSTGVLDTNFVDTLINTTDNFYRYEISLLVDGVVKNVSANASSIFLNIGEFDKTLKLNWAETVPWTNYKYVVHQETSPGSGIFKVVDTVTSASYVHDSLINGTTYCYKIEALGKYTALPQYDTLINFSQIVCAEPKDTVPPCAPKIILTSNCTTAVNTVSWQLQKKDCDSDLGKISIYYKSTFDGKFEKVFETSDKDASQHTFDNLTSVAGCYLITATDTVGNESKLVNDTCVDNCPIYLLPNVFTPNDDEWNNKLKSINYKFIKSIDFVIYNRWGNEIFKTNDIDINWDGTNMYTKQKASPGVYYYVCTVNEIRLEGIVPRKINGFVYLLK